MPQCHAVTLETRGSQRCSGLQPWRTLHIAACGPIRQASFSLKPSPSKTDASCVQAEGKVVPAPEHECSSAGLLCQGGLCAHGIAGALPLSLVRQGEEMAEALLFLQAVIPCDIFYYTISPGSTMVMHCS